MRLIPVSAAALLLCVSAAAYATEAIAPTQDEGEAQAEKPKKVCRMETSTGSVMPKRVCRTPEQVASEQEAARRTREEMNRGRGL